MIDERILFDGFHDALDLEPRPGAFERFQFAFTHHPVALKRRPRPMRFSKMTFRIAAVAMAAIIAIAAVAAYIASHRTPFAAVPAHSTDQNLLAYQSLMITDYGAMDASTSNHCNTIADTACAQAIDQVLPTLQKWIADLQGFKTPVQDQYLDMELRAHLGLAIVDLDAAKSFQAAKDALGFDLAMNGALYERAWLDPTSFAIEGSYTRVSASYTDAAATVRLALKNCVTGTPAPADIGCQTISSSNCDVSGMYACQPIVQWAATQIQTMLIAFLQNPAPPASAAGAAAVQRDLAKADAQLVAITAAVLKSDPVGVHGGERAFAVAISAAYDDITINS